MLIFSLGSILAPVLFPALCTNPYLLKMTNPKPLERVFIAHEQDIALRNREIKKWEASQAAGIASGARPLPLVLGEKFTKVDKLPAKAIFWTQGLRLNESRKTYGKGMLNLELIVVDKFGFDLAENSYALNETIRVIIRTVLPFLILIVVALLTRPEDKKRLDRFFARMKTKVHPDPQKDAEEVKLSYQNPFRFDEKKLFPRSQWEFYKWDKVDAGGFAIAVLVLLAIIAMLKIVVSIGG